MHWDFPVPSGTTVTVRLYFANRYTGTSQVGQRVFDVAVNGTTLLPNFDIVAAAGDQTGTMRSVSEVSPVDITIDLTHEVENPLIDGIEIVADQPAPAAADHRRQAALAAPRHRRQRRRDEHGRQRLDPAVEPGRGAFYLGGAALLRARARVASTSGPSTAPRFGAAVAKIDPYDDPAWQNVQTGSGQTYASIKSDYYTELPNVTSAFYSGGRIYYTLFGQSQMYYRYFTPDSGVIGSQEFTVNDGLDWSDVGGMFTDNNNLYYVFRSTGALYKVPFTNGAPNGTPVDVNDPGTGGDNWSARAVFIGPTPPPNQLPVARASVTCPDLSCTFDGTASSDPDGHVVSYAWDFGDGLTDTGATPSHTYAQEGTYSYTLTVTDNRGGTDQTTGSIKVTDPATSPIHFGGATGAVAGTNKPAVTVPGAAQAGDLLLMTAALSSSTVTASDPTGVTGWTLLGTTDANGMKSMVWWKYAGASDHGTKVTVPLSAGAKSTLQVLDYTGVDPTQPIDAFASANDTTTKSAHVSPTITSGSGDWVVSLWADKSSATTAWTAPNGVTSRDAEFGTGSGYVSALASDSASATGHGSYGGLTATTNQAGTKATSWTIAIAS